MLKFLKQQKLEENIIDNILWVEAAFEFKNYMVRNVPVANLVNTRLNRLKNTWEKLGGNVDTFKTEAIELEGDNLLSQMQAFEKIQGKLKFELYNANDYNQLRVLSEQLLYAESVYEKCFLAHNATLPSYDAKEVKIQEKLDTGVLLRSIQNPAQYPDIQAMLQKEKTRILKKRNIIKANV